MKTLKLNIILLLAFLMLYGNLNCQTIPINFDSIRAAYNQYNQVNHKRFKDIFVKLHYGKYDKKYGKYLWKDNIFSNLDSLSITAIPFLDLCFDENDTTKIKSFKLDTNLIPERCFVSYKGRLLGFIKFAPNLGFDWSDFFPLDENYWLYEFYQCQISYGVLISISSRYFVLDDKNNLFDYRVCSLSEEAKKSINESSLIDLLITEYNQNMKFLNRQKNKQKLFKNSCEKIMDFQLEDQFVH